MTAPVPADLDPFETALLARLRDVVAEHATQPAPAPARRPRRTRARLAAAVAALAAGAVAVPGLLASPAYSVNEGNDGTVRVEVNRFDDAVGLRAALAAHGIAADVTFLPAGRQCASGRYPATSRSGLTLSVGSDEHFAVTLAPGAVRDGETLVVAASATTFIGSDGQRGVRAWLDADVTPGPVAPCAEVPATP